MEGPNRQLNVGQINTIRYVKKEILLLVMLGVENIFSRGPHSSTLLYLWYINTEYKGWLVCVLWHINLCRLFNVMSTQFLKQFYFKQFSLV